MRFMSEMVNARDVNGNTALNLVARIGNRSIIQQLLEVQADPNIPNYKGLTAAAFLGEADGLNRADSQAMESPGKRATSKILELSNEIVPGMFWQHPLFDYKC
jgi:regulatory protein SWI6